MTIGDKDYLKFLKTSLQKIKTYYENNKLALFLGAGISIDSGLPTWKEVIDSLKNDLFEDGDNFNEIDPLKLAQFYYLRYGENVYYEKLLNIFNLDNKQPNKLIEELVKLNCEYIVTTNFDDLLEKAIEENFVFYEVIKEDNDFSKASFGSKLLIKMHGDLKSRNIVFKENDYLSYSDKFPLIETFVKSIFIRNVVIFIGYSLSDFNVKQIVSWVQNRRRNNLPIYFIEVVENFNCFEFEYYKDKGIYILYIKEMENEFLEIIKNISEIENLSSESKLILGFLKKIKSKGKNISTFKNFEEFINEIYEVLKPFKDIDYVSAFDLVRIFKKKFKVEGIGFLRYGEPYIYIYDNKLLELLKLNSSELSKIKKNKVILEKIKFIFDIFKKSNCVGIKLFELNNSIAANPDYVINFNGQCFP